MSLGTDAKQTEFGLSESEIASIARRLSADLPEWARRFLATCIPSREVCDFRSKHEMLSGLFAEQGPPSWILPLGFISFGIGGDGSDYAIDVISGAVVLFNIGDIQSDHVQAFDQPDRRAALTHANLLAYAVDQRWDDVAHFSRSLETKIADYRAADLERQRSGRFYELTAGESFTRSLVPQSWTFSYRFPPGTYDLAWWIEYWHAGDSKPDIIDLGTDRGLPASGSLLLQTGRSGWFSSSHVRLHLGPTERPRLIDLREVGPANYQMTSIPYGEVMAKDGIMTLLVAVGGNAGDQVVIPTDLLQTGQAILGDNRRALIIRARIS